MGIGADTSEGEFHILNDDPGMRKTAVSESLTLAEGIESITYRYFLQSNTVRSTLPPALDSIKQIEITIIAKSLVQDKHTSDDGYARDTLRAKVNYHQTF